MEIEHASCLFTLKKLITRNDEEGNERRVKGVRGVQERGEDRIPVNCVKFCVSLILYLDLSKITIKI